MSEWHYSKNNQQQGPVSAEQLKQMAASVPVAAHRLGLEARYEPKV